MNIAYLILAHGQPLQLVRLIERLDQPNVSFFIHIDKKSKYVELITDQLSGYKNVKIISTQRINWMGYKMVKGTLDLLSLAYSSGIHFKYYVLLSGQDYPIKSNERINEFFTAHDTDFISYNNIAHFPGNNYTDKVRFFHYYDLPYTNPRHQKKVPLLVYLYFGIQKRLKKFMPKRRFYKGFVPYFGSQWFAFTEGTVKYILDFVKENKGYIEFMKYTEGPDETFFPTIIMNSPRKTNLYDYDKYAAWLRTRNENELFAQGYSSLRYMDWSERGKSKPAVLDSSYFETLEASNYLFARKFDAQVSANLMELIDKKLLNHK